MRFSDLALYGSLLVASVSLGTLSCGSSGARGDSFDDGGASPGGDPTGGFVDGGGSTFVDGSSGTHDPTSGGGASTIYAHTNTTLYTLDPADVTRAPARVGDFDCIGNGVKAMTDFAVSKDGSLYGVSESAAYPLTVQGGKVHCAATWTLPSSPQTRFYALTMAPEGTVERGEVLVAANGGGQLYKIDSQTGNTTQVGDLGSDPSSGRPWSLSGDLVFLANGGTPVGFATVRTCATSKKGVQTCDKVDTLVEVDVAAIKPGAGSVLKAVRGRIHGASSCAAGKPGGSYGTLFGIAAFSDKVYGFSHVGEIYSIDNKDGSACLLGVDANRAWSGAGVTTIAPVVSPPH